MSAEPSSSINTVDNKAVNNDSDYDEGLDIPDETHHGVTFSSDEKDGEDQEPVTALPFKTIHNTPVKFKAPVRKVFIPNQRIELQIIDHERSVTSHILNPYLYTIELVHGSFSWTIKKRYKHFQLLHSQLKIYRATLNIPFPTKTHRERRTSFKHDLNRTKRSAGGLPRFPAKPDGLIPEEQIESRIQELQEYLKALLRIPLYRNHHETLAFLEVSELSFVAGLGGMGGKGKEGAILKRTRSTRPAASAQCNLCGLMDAALCVRCQFVCGDVCGAWRNRWLLVKDSCVAYVRPRDGRLRCVMLFDAAFEVSSGLFSTGLRRGLHITNACRQITIKCPTRRTTREWMAYIKDSAHKIGFSSQCRYTSFAPVRDAEVSRAAWLVDGRSYMAAVADAMEAAREEIYIADWWLSPEIHMKRPALHGDYWRLDHIIRRKAEAGVKIFLLLYKEVEIALGINSFYSKQTIAKCHPENVKVLRHPDHTKAGVFLWAHHEKVVVVDQSVALVGGIDLCYGRWDDHHHRLTDLGSIKHRDSSAVITAESAALAENVAAAATTAEQSSIVSLVKMTNSLSVGVVKLSSQSDDSMKIVNDTNNPAEPNTSEMMETLLTSQARRTIRETLLKCSEKIFSPR
ncbi:phospholipase D1-like [Nilaparvata lugens]|uniref:phospholipase D1-like n=1 Tax=Nilaparvata lugens TaxID=108931 RepID=UPI00193D65E5|nr:phospholipase D1-like [Nilaparvata lugens]